jgi:plasmid stabilization system protein ParE
MMPTGIWIAYGTISPTIVSTPQIIWIGRLFDAFDSIANAPGIGHKREDLTTHPVLFWPVGSYLIIYQATSRAVAIVAVTQGARDIPAFLLKRLAL